MMLYQMRSIQQSIWRIWDMLPRTEFRELTMEGYVELNLRLQKCLSEDYHMELALDSAISDWGVDVQEGHKAMTGSNFFNYFFELTARWCGPRASLRVYLLFLNTIFIAITDCRGTHSVGLKPLEEISRLPSAFFDLISLQGWPADQTQVQPLVDWQLNNTTAESEKEAIELVQKQVFQLLCDARATVLFVEEEDRADYGFLDKVKAAAGQLDRVVQSRSRDLALPAAELPGLRLATITGRGWCPPNYGKVPGASQVSRVADARAGAYRRQPLEPLPNPPQVKSLPPRRAPALEAPWPPRKETVPVGRAYETQLARPKLRGLVLAGPQTLAAVVAKMQPNYLQQHAAIGNLDPGTMMTMPTEESSLHTQVQHLTTHSEAEGYRGTFTEEQDVPLDSEPLSASLALQDRTIPIGRSAALSAREAASTPTGYVASMYTPSPRNAAVEGVASQDLDSPLHYDTLHPQGAKSPVVFFAEMLEAHPISEEISGQDTGQSAQSSPTLVEASLPPAGYELPRRVPEIYRNQVKPLMKQQPSSIVFQVVKYQAEHEMLPPPFERVLAKLPENLRPAPGTTPLGPMGHTCEPIWFEMTHRLEAIMRKQGKRAERKRKRRIRAKLFHGHPPVRLRKGDGEQLMDYIEQAAAEGELGQDEPGDPPGEFLKKAHQRTVARLARAELPRFQFGKSGGVVARMEIGAPEPPQQRAVRPVYLPPPGGKAVVY